MLVARDGLIVLFDKWYRHKRRIIQTSSKSCNLK
jgi:hypothetical protein